MNWIKVYRDGQIIGILPDTVSEQAYLVELTNNFGEAEYTFVKYE